jgi:hypothetical protein
MDNIEYLIVNVINTDEQIEDVLNEDYEYEYLEDEDIHIIDGVKYEEISYGEEGFFHDDISSHLLKKQ